ncbi:hypothetical protein [Cupriavidus sp. UYPR2.512]|uniref:hypothetical protein n=1 Tax=Cupriavidus sp. UYPR2.512 TaxID=1080187 RepID=UPI0018E00C3F|nr:hypothetical protein [Cupriavidus sp. UYPR2.512]UIF84658.1 hypothetical protein KAF44_10210 [Cupriavidus necator]
MATRRHIPERCRRFSNSPLAFTPREAAANAERITARRIELRLDPDDDAQVIFESLNGRGERLTPADLIRNFVFLEATRADATMGRGEAESRVRVVQAVVDRGKA